MMIKSFGSYCFLIESFQEFLQLFWSLQNHSYALCYYGHQSGCLRCCTDIPLLALLVRQVDIFSHWLKFVVLLIVFDGIVKSGLVFFWPNRPYCRLCCFPVCFVQ